MVKAGEWEVTIGQSDSFSAYQTNTVRLWLYQIQHRCHSLLAQGSDILNMFMQEHLVRYIPIK